MTILTKANHTPDLWPKAPFAPDFAPGGGPARAREAWGEEDGIGILDIGALKTEGPAEVWRIFMPGGWVNYNSRDASHLAHARRFSRYGPGQSFGGALLQGHGRVLRDQARIAWKKRFDETPSELDLTDIEFNLSLARELGLTGDVSPAPPPVAATTEQLDRMEKLLLAVVEKIGATLSILILAGLLGGCSALRTLIPGGVTAADAEWSGVKSAQPVSIVGAIDPRAGAIAALLEGLGQEDSVGVLLPLTLIGETAPRWVLCTDKLAAKCKEIPLHAKVNFAGRPIGPGLIWKPSRLVADDFND